MDSKEKWNYIVSRYHELYNAQEKAIQEEWESYCSEIFNYKKYSKEIDVFRSMQIGSRERIIPDIILKTANKDLIDIELKQYNSPFDIKFETQLKSYLKLLSLTVGIIVCQKIHLCWLNTNEDKMYNIAIPFEKDNAYGIKLIDLLCKDTFSAENIKAYITTKFDIQEIKNKITTDFINDLLSNYFEKEKYCADAIKQALDEINISVSEKKPISNSTTGSYRDNGEKTKTGGRQPPQPPIYTDFPTAPPFIIIKTKQDRVNVCKHYFNCSDDEALYHATRHCWRVSYESVIRYDYVLAVIDSYVKEVYKVKQWNQVHIDDAWDIDVKVEGRFEFVGEVAEDSIRKKFIGKLIPYEYRKPGMASPIVFSDLKSKEY